MLRRVQKFVTSLLLAPVLASTLWVVCLNAAALAGGPGDLDPSFGVDGVVTTTVSSGSNFVSASGRGIAIQADGKIVVAGYSFNNDNADFGVVRYNPDGSLDTGFGNGGIITTSIQNGQDYAEDVAIQADGKIVVAGPTVNGSEATFALVRYLPTGELDSDFGIGGIVTTTFDSNAAFNQAVAVQQGDGKIVTVGFAKVGDQDDFALVRYHHDGSLDAGFGSGGKVTTSFSSGNDNGMDIAIQADGKIVVAGRKDYVGANPDFAVARYHPNGSLDGSFGSGGKVITSITNNDERVYELAIQPDGKIVVGGISSFSFTLVRYDPDGSPDTNFGSGGVITTPVGSTGDFGPAVALQADDKILLAGHSIFGSDHTFTLVRYNANGSLDTGFGSGGIVTEPAGGGLAVAIQADGKIVAAGSGSNESVFTVVRYLGDPILSITKRVELARSPAVPGDPVTYTVVLANSGSDAADVTVEDQLPDYLIGVDLSETVNITGGQALTFTLSAKLAEDAPYGLIITNTASYSHTSGSGQTSAAFTVAADPTLPDSSIYLPMIINFPVQK